MSQTRPPAARARRLAVVVLAALVAISLAPLAGAQGATGESAPTPQVVTTQPAPGGPVHFHGDTASSGGSVVASSARSAGRTKARAGAKAKAGVKAKAKAKARAKARAKKARAKARAQQSVAWRGGVLRYTESLPAEWDWSLQQAVAQWNASGADVRLVPATSAATSQLRISMGSIGAAAGLATVGRTQGAFVKLSDHYAGVDATDAYYRVEVMAVLAHEIGHVLGLEHTSARCGLMSPVLDIAGCGTWRAAVPGEYRCPVLQGDAVPRAVTLYGGRARAASGVPCLVDPHPGSLQDVALEPHAEGFTVSWTPPSPAPAASMVYVRWWDGSCEQVPGEAPIAAAWLEDRTWTHAGAVPDCVSVTPVNRYGLGPAPVLLPAVA